MTTDEKADTLYNALHSYKEGLWRDYRRDGSDLDGEIMDEILRVDEIITDGLYSLVAA